MHVLQVIGARPNFVKAAPVIAALGARGVRQTIVHTGQHYDRRLSDDILAQLGMPIPDVNLGVGSGSHAEQTAQVLIGIAGCIEERKPDLVLLYGDVNSTLASALAAVKLGVEIGHVEAGLRSGDWTMPEEINRVLTDRISTHLYTPSSDADANLVAEGISPAQIHRVGNVMIDTLQRLIDAAPVDRVLRQLGLLSGTGPKPYALVTLHRPSNVDAHDMLVRLVRALTDIGRSLPVVFPVHPRTRKHIDAAHIDTGALVLTEPLAYLEFLALQKHATVVITDSGGIQEETTYLGVPCLTMRDNTERPITVAVGTNLLIGHDLGRLQREVETILAGNAKRGAIPPLWDGHTAERIADHLLHNRPSGH